MNKKILIALIVTSALTLIIGVALIILNNLNKNTLDSNITEKAYNEEDLRKELGYYTEETYEKELTGIEGNMDDKQQEDQEFDAETYANVAESWVGTYTNGDITVKLIRRGKIRLDYIMPGISGIFDTASQEKLTDKEDSFGVTNSIKIERIQNGVKITASSTDSESILNKCNGEYTLQEFSKSNWNGIYTNGDKSITISEINENELYITMDTPQLLNYQINLDGSVFSGNSNYSEREINYELKITDTKKLKITKTTDGIEVISSSTDKSDLLNSMSGTYYKQ